MASALFDQQCRFLGIRAQVASAGLLEAGVAPPDEVAALMAQYGIDVTSHRSRLMQIADVDGATLVIGLERRHVREAVLASSNRAAWARSFTLREVVRRADAVGPRQTGQPFGSWVGALHDGRRPLDLLDTSPVDDVADPIGRGLAATRDTAIIIADLTARLAALMVPGRS
jgi:protein-tyrosine phosphatase